MRLFIPNKIITDTDEEEQEKTNADLKSKKSNLSESKVFKDAEILKEEINKISNSNNVLGETIAILKDVQMMYPRGKINIHFLKNTLKITGPSNDYKIPYNHINKAFLLPKHDGVSVAFVVGLTTPMRQGNTSYNFIVFQMKKETNETVDITYPDDGSKTSKEIKELGYKLTGEVFSSMAKLFTMIIGIGVAIPGKFKRYNLYN